MSHFKKELGETIYQLRERIVGVEKGGIHLSEEDTRQGLIGPLFRKLGWDFSDPKSVKSEFTYKNYGGSIDYAFFSAKDKKHPVLLVQVKALGENLDDNKTVKQLCSYLKEMGVQWGLLTDGNRYVMYNSNAGISFEDKKFLTLEIKAVDTEYGIPLDTLMEKFMALLERDCLENQDIQRAYEFHTINKHIRYALDSLLAKPFENLATAIKKEFKEERVKIDPKLKISTKEILSYFEMLKDEEGRIQLDPGPHKLYSDDRLFHYVALSQEEDVEFKDFVNRERRVTVLDLLRDNMVKEGDNWRFEYKGEVTLGRLTGNGEIEINGSVYPTLSRAGFSICKKPCLGWTSWYYKDKQGRWDQVTQLRHKYQEKHGSEVSMMKRTKSAA